MNMLSHTGLLKITTHIVCLNMVMHESHSTAHHLLTLCTHAYSLSIDWCQLTGHSVGIISHLLYIREHLLGRNLSCYVTDIMVLP